MTKLSVRSPSRVSSTRLVLGFAAAASVTPGARAQEPAPSTPAVAEPAPPARSPDAAPATEAAPTEPAPPEAGPEPPPPAPPEAALPPEPPPPEPPLGAEDEGPSAGPFRQAAVRLSLLLGSGESSTDTYFILGAGAGYYVLNGLELGADYEAWLGGSPTLQRLSPEARYVLWFVPTIKPYLGFFYRHTFVSGYDGLNSLGGRAGVYYAPERSRMYLGGGVAYERYLACTDSVLGDCDELYPELAFGVSF
jgi:hypothetical protein